MNAGAESTHWRSLSALTLLKTFAHVDSLTNQDVFEEEGVRTLSLPQRQSNVRGEVWSSAWVLRKETTYAATIRKQPTRL
jgi:hypothetical protein